MDGKRADSNRFAFRLSPGNPPPSARGAGEGWRGMLCRRPRLKLLLLWAAGRFDPRRVCDLFWCMEPAGLEPATSRSEVDNPPPSARETRTRSGEGCSALPLSYGPVLPCCAARLGGAAGRSALAPGVACPRASGSAPAGHPSTVRLLHLHRRPPPPSAGVSLQTKIAPPGVCAGGATVSLPGCGSGHALMARTLPELPRWLSSCPSCPRVRSRTAYRNRCRVRRTGARPRPADRRTPATPRATRGPRRSVDCRRVCRASVPASVPCRRYGV